MAPSRVFVSHSHSDNDFGVRLVQDLRRALGGDETAVWYDVSGGLHGGDEWWDVILKEMAARPVFLAVLSPEAMQSNWVQAEMRIAWTLKHSPSDSLDRLLIPILYKPCEVRADWGTLQMVSFAEPRPYEAALAELLTALGAPSAPAPVPSVPPVNAAAALVHQLLPTIEAAFGAGDWADVTRKAEFLIGRAREAVPPSIYRMQGRALLEEGNTAGARIAYDAALALDSTDVPTLQAAARVRLDLGERGEGISLLRDALALADNYAQRLELLHVYAQALAMQGNWAEVVRTVEEGLHLAPDDPDWLAQLLDALQQTKQDPEALEVARTLTAHAAATAEQWIARARLAYAVVGDAGDAEVRAALDAAARLAPNDPAVTQERRELLTLIAPRFSERLASLGFTIHEREGVAYIVPPLCTVPAGPFLMGSSRWRDRQAADNELPQHQVSLPAFQIARFPVTVAEYACALRLKAVSEPRSTWSKIDWQTQLQRLDHPVVGVSWYHASLYTDWLAKTTGQPWRLPSEAEWEKAARWDTERRVSRRYPWGDTFDTAHCNTSESGIHTTTPVGSYPNGASPCGAQDMAGNVLEWVRTIFKPYPYQRDDSWDGWENQLPNDDDSKILRGGSWLDDARAARAASRRLQREYLMISLSPLPDNVRDDYEHESAYGFRLVLASANS